MRNCPECGGDVRDQHSFCPECAAPMSSAAKAASNSDSTKDESATGLLDGSGDGDGLGRREYMLYGGAAVGTAVAGAGVGFLALSGDSGGRGPEATARTFFERFDAGDVEGVESMFHEDVDTGQTTEDQVSRMERIDLAIQSTEVLSQNDTHAKVSVVMNVSTEGQTRTQNNTLLLRTQNGEWRVRGIKF